MKKNGCTIAFAAISAIFIFMSCKPEVKIQTKEVEKLVEVDKKADEVAPADVTNLKATPKESRVLLTWTDAADEDVYGYGVSYSTADAGRVVLPALEKNAFIVAKGLGGTYVPNLTNGTEYTFTVKTVDTSGNKSQGVTAKSTPACGDTIKMDLTVDVPHLNGYTGNKSNTYVTVTAKIASDSRVKKVMYRPIDEELFIILGYMEDTTPEEYNYSITADSVFSDDKALEFIEDPLDNTKWTFVIDGTKVLFPYAQYGGSIKYYLYYQVAVIDEAGRENTQLLLIDNFDFDVPSNALITSAVYSSSSNSLSYIWKDNYSLETPLYVGIKNIEYSSNPNTITFTWEEPPQKDYTHIEITYTSNDEISDTAQSSVLSIPKGTTEVTCTGIDTTKEYYLFTFTTLDDIGNKRTRKPLKIYVNENNGLPQDFVKVPGRTVNGNFYPSQVFIQGRTVTISDMYVCDHEVTQGEYETYCKYGNFSPSEDYGVGENFPAYYVNWYDAVVYCNLRSISENLTPVYSIDEETDPTKWTGIVSQTTDGVTKYCGPSSSNSSWDSLVFNASANGYRLPTEAEWEYIACEANTSTTRYSGSNEIDVSWNYNNSESKTHEVKGKKSNAICIYDMCGNVAEWIYDWYSDVDTTTAATGSASGSERVKRGGGYDDTEDVYHRLCRFPYFRYDDIGFRVVRNAN